MAMKPRAMVLVFNPTLTHSVWQDLISRHRTVKGLEKHLRKGVRDGEWVGWRIIQVEKEVRGFA
jgi:hypothetical protein